MWLRVPPLCSLKPPSSSSRGRGSTGIPSPLTPSPLTGLLHGGQVHKIVHQSHSLVRPDHSASAGVAPSFLLNGYDPSSY